MKPIVRCEKCAECVIVSTAGFVSEDHLWCSQRDGEVDPDDGCTFGTRGSPRRGQINVTVDVSGCAIVNQYDE